MPADYFLPDYLPSPPFSSSYHRNRETFHESTIDESLAYVIQYEIGKIKKLRAKGTMRGGRETGVDTIRSKRRFVEIFKIDRVRCQFLGNCRSTDELCQRAVSRAIRASNLFRIFLWEKRV